MFTANFKQLSKNDIALAGGKGASLGEMTRTGLSIPSGFVVLASAFDQFLEDTDLNIEIETILKKVNPKEMESVEKASEEIRNLIDNSKMSKNLRTEIIKEFKRLKTKFVAVRSSATAEDSKVASWAGALETYLNVTEENLIKSVIKCWSSLFTPRAIFYRFEKNLHKQKVSVAVVIQKMVQSEISGICFSVHPITKDKNQMIIEAGFGLGEAIVGGRITPDTYVIHKDNFSILDINVSEQNIAIVRSKNGNLEKKLTPKQGSQQKLSVKQIVELSKICKGIEKHYKHPQDIEWAFEKGKFYITQARPITTL